MRRTLPTGMAVGDESGSVPIRTATSMPSSSIDTTRSTSNARPRIAAYRLRKRVSIGVTCNAPDICGAVTVSKPPGALCRPAARRSTSSSSANRRRQSLASCRPASVNRMVRVLRTTSSAPSRDSSWAMVRVTVAVEMPSRRATAATLACSARAANSVISWVRSTCATRSTMTERGNLPKCRPD